MTGIRQLSAACALFVGLTACGSPELAEPPIDIDPGSVELPAPGTATEATISANRALADRLPLADPSDGEDAARGFLAALEGDAILDGDGNPVWAIPQFDFLAGDAPDTVNPSLWRQSGLAAKHGLFEVTDGIYQVRGYDLAVMSIIEGETGWIIVDPLTNIETAAASLKLVNDTLGERPVTGMIYTHSHVDHFGGARGIIEEPEIAERNVPVIAPVGFAEHAVSENLLAGNHMARRSTLMFGMTIPASETGKVGIGLGPGIPQGTVSLVLPTEELKGEVTQRIIDGVLFEFIDASGTEAPSEFMFYLPEKRALCTAEVATGTLHNVLTPRGAQVRDARAWSRVIDHVLSNYGDKSDVVFASHHWPSWGSENVQKFLTGQRDIYRYIHDQTLRAANSGSSQVEAAEALEEPDFQSDSFDTRGYYGTLNHNAKAVYQHYYGWWSGVPADYHKLPRVETARRYVEAMGGGTAVLEKGQVAFATGDYRWSAELLNHLMFAAPDSKPARDWLAASYEQLGFQAESGAWRSYYLSAAAELRRGLPTEEAVQLGSPDFLKAVPTIDIFDMLATRYVPGSVKAAPYAVEFRFPDTDEIISLLVEPSVLVPREQAATDPAAVMTINRSDFDRLLLGEASQLGLFTSGKLKVSGNRGRLSAIFDNLETPEFWFNVVEP